MVEGGGDHAIIKMYEYGDKRLVYGGVYRVSKVRSFQSGLESEWVRTHIRFTLYESHKNNQLIGGWWLAGGSHMLMPFVIVTCLMSDACYFSMDGRPRDRWCEKAR